MPITTRIFRVTSVPHLHLIAQKWSLGAHHFNRLCASLLEIYISIAGAQQLFEKNRRVPPRLLRKASDNFLDVTLIIAVVSIIYSLLGGNIIIWYKT